MKRSRNRPRVAPIGSAPGDERRIEALTVAMALAPGVYARNRMFDLFRNAGVQRAKARAATLRGIVKHLGRATSLTLESGPLDYVLRYEIAALCLTRVVELTRVELAALRMLASRAGVSNLPADDGDRALVEATLARLLVAGDVANNLARAAADSTPPPGE